MLENSSRFHVGKNLLQRRVDNSDNTITQRFRIVQIIILYPIYGITLIVHYRYFDNTFTKKCIQRIFHLS